MRKDGPNVDPRRAKDLLAELTARARAWLPASRARAPADAGAALLQIAARLSAEVTQRLDQTPKKVALGFLDWLGVKGDGGRAARLPVVFKMSSSSTSPVFAQAPLRIQAQGESPITFETLEHVTLIPSPIGHMVGVDAQNDEIFLPPARVLSLERPTAGPAQWTVRTLAVVGSDRIQLTPTLGLDAGKVLEIDGAEYRIATKPEGDIVQIEPAIGADLEAERQRNVPAGALATESTAFDPFGDKTRNAQKHELYIGDEETLNLKAPALIEVAGAAQLAESVTWHYWGKADNETAPKWRDLKYVGSHAEGVFLKKDDDAPFEVREIGVRPVRSGRWLRATRTPAPQNADPVPLSNLSLKVNCADPANLPKAIASHLPGDTGERPTLEGIASNTSLVLDQPFYPFGKIPRQFDSFYLTCAEAFSKPGASAVLDFKMADGAMDAPAIVETPSDGILVFGVANDGALHRYVIKEGASPTASDPTRPGASTLDTGETRYRFPPVVFVQDDPTDAAANTIEVFAPFANQVWRWKQPKNAGANGEWTSVGQIGSTPAKDRIKQLIRVHEFLAALTIEGRLFVAARSEGVWTAVKTNAPDKPKFVVIAPIHDAAEDRNQTTEGVFLAVTDAGQMVSVRFKNGAWIEAESLTGTNWTWPPDFAPLAVVVANSLFVVARTVSDHRCAIGGLRCTISSSGFENATKLTESKCPPRTAGNAFAWTFDSTLWPAGAKTLDLFLIAPGSSESEGVLRWSVSQINGNIARQPPIFVSGSIGATSTGIAATRSRLIAPGDGRNLAATRTKTTQATIRQGALTSAVATKQFDPYDVLKFGAGDDAPIDRVSNVARSPLPDGRYAYLPKPGLAPSSVQHFPAPDWNDPNNADTTEDAEELKIPTAAKVVKDCTLLVRAADGSLSSHSVTDVDAPVGGKKIATLKPKLPIQHPSEVDYWIYDAPTFPEVNDVACDVLPAVDRANIEGQDTRIGDVIAFPAGVNPTRQVVAAVVDLEQKSYAVLEHKWQTAPADAAIVVDTVGLEWARYLGTVDSNPQLSWEYSNGTGWSKLKDVQDFTANFKVTGRVEFSMPADIKPTDVLGKEKYWIRARLVGGDYGRETFDVVTTDIASTQPGDTDKKQKQSVTVSTDDIRAPIVLHIGIAYSICEPREPKFVLTFDSASWRDESDANRARGAEFDAFAPVAKVLRDAALTKSPAGDGNGESEPSRNRGSTPASPDAPANITRAIYLAFEKAVAGKSVRILFLTDDQDHAETGSLIVEGLRDGRFEPLTVTDETGALARTGMLTLAMDAPLTEWEMFGKPARWIRLRPAKAHASWNPRIRGAYVNAAWAHAAESQIMEIVDSADGSPNLTVRLARTPVLENTLELRVREPVSDEEMVALNMSGHNVVEDADGRWVLWRSVGDPADHGPDERVYGLDFATGEIRFGDGVHGLIPHAGRDAIVAFKYSRGGGAAANAVQKFDELSLVTPVEGVEAAFAPEPATGGADPQSPEAVLQFAAPSLRHRQRAVTLRDLEDIARAYAPDVAQARALPGKKGVKIVVVMAGEKSAPSQAFKLGLARHLQDRGSPSLRAPHALEVVGPREVKFRLEVQLNPTAQHLAGRVDRDVKDVVKRFFHPRDGGTNGRGWKLGASPSDVDVAAVITSVDGVRDVVDVSFMRDGDTKPVKTLAIAPDCLARLVEDGVTITLGKIGAAA